MTSASKKRIAAAVAALGLVGFGLGYLGTWPPFATVMSGSMAPAIKTGDMVVLKRLHALPHVGDIVAVNVPDAARSRYGYPPVVTHRVVRVAPDGTITTKGDARPTPDPFTVKRSALTAKVVMHIPAGGRVLAFLVSPLGLLWLAAGAVMLFFMPLLERRQAAEQDALDGLRVELHAISEELARLRTEPVQAEPAAAEEEPMPTPAAETTAETVEAVELETSIDWLDLETHDESHLAPHWPEPAEFLPGYVPFGREPASEAQPELEPITYVVRRRSGGLLARLR
jgi:signal peptidase I